MDVIITPILVLAGAAGATVWAVRQARRQRERTQQVWQAAAEALGGRFDPPGGRWYRRTPAQIEAQLDGVRVLVDHYTVSTGKSSQTYTRVRAYGAEPGTLHVTVQPERGLTALGKALGGRDLDLGDPEFDGRFVVKANDDPFARAWLQGDFTTHARSAPRYGFVLSDGKTTAQTMGIELDPGVLAAVARATATLAGGGARILARWRACAEALGGTLEAAGSGWASDETTVLRADVQGVPVIVDGVTLREGFLVKSAHVLTRVRAVRLSAGTPEDCWAAYRGKPPPAADALPPVPAPEGMEAWEWRAADATRAQSRFPPALRLRAAALAPELVQADERTITLLLAGVETEPARMREAADVAAALAARAPDAPYR